MMGIKALTHSVANIRSFATINQDIDDELAFHIECRVDDLMAEGRSRAEAESQARDAFGSTDRIRKECQNINYGIRIWFNRIAITGLVLSSVAIVVLVYALLSLQDQHSQLVLEMEQTRAVLASAENKVNSEPAVPVAKVNEDLTGTVRDNDNQPIANAKIALIYKSWPNGRFRQDVMDSETDESGKFVFTELYPRRQQTAVLVSVVVDGYEMQSEYLVNRTGKKLKPFRFKLAKSQPKTFVLMKNGKPLVGAEVFVQSRSSEDGEEHMVYQHSGKDLCKRTDKEGKVALNVLMSGDSAVLGVIENGGIRDVNVKVDSNAVQVIGGKPSAEQNNDVKGIVLDKNGKPIVGADILLVHKSWPGGRYRQDFFTEKTDDNGSFVFADQYEVGNQYGFLVSVVSDGWAMESQYVFEKSGDPVGDFNFALSESTTKKFKVVDEDGNPVAGALVYPSSRKSKDGEYLIYGQMANEVGIKTNEQGIAELNVFSTGDTAVIGVIRSSGESSESEISVDENEEQTVSLKKNERNR